MSMKEKEGFNDVENFFKRARENARQLDKEAQEVAQVVPEAVMVEEPETVTVDSSVVMAHMVKALQELNEKKQDVDTYAYLKQPFKHFENLKPMVAPSAEPKEDVVEIKKDNMIVIDDVTGESIPPITHEKIEVHIAPGMHEEHHVPVKTLEPKYDYDEPFSFKEKNVRDGGKF